MTDLSTKIHEDALTWEWTGEMYVADAWGNVGDPLVDTTKTFTRSDGTLVSRLYERLTKASRRRWDAGLGAAGEPGSTWYEKAYRQGVYDAFKAIQEELQN